MFNVGDVVVYGTHGVCRIGDISSRDLGIGMQQYYVLNPVFDEKSVFYVPTANIGNSLNLRTVLTKEQFEDVIKDAVKRDVTWIDDDIKRKEFFTTAIKSCDCQALMQTIQMLYLHQENLKVIKKHVHLSDERFFKTAEKMLHDEIAWVFNIKREEIPAFIAKRIKEI